MLVKSSLNARRKDFRNPLIEVGTFGAGQEKHNKKEFSKFYKGEFIGMDSPPSTTYITEKSAFDKEIYTQKGLTRERRICPMVSKH